MTASAPSPDQTAADRDDDVLVRITTSPVLRLLQGLDDVSSSTVVRRRRHRRLDRGNRPLRRTVNRLSRIQEGQIEIDGIPLPQEGRALAQLRTEVEMVSSPSTSSHRTVLDNITPGAHQGARAISGRAEGVGP